MSKKTETYISIDIEADGPIPGPFSMLQLGAAAFDLSSEDPRKPIDTFKVNLDLIEGATQDPDTMAWWGRQNGAYENTRIDTQPPEDAMKSWVSWLRALPGKPVIVGYPVTYDFTWVYWYTVRFGLGHDERSPFGFQGLDLKTVAWMKLRENTPLLPYKHAAKRRMPKEWFRGAPKHTHDGLDDAIGQGVLFINMMGDQ
jgi:hypothetical protein